MRESIEDQKFPDSSKRVLEVAAKKTSGPSEAELVIISLLMRIYDVNLALLSHFNSEVADEIHDGHAEGKSFNPPMFIPALESVNVDEDTGPVA